MIRMKLFNRILLLLALPAAVSIFPVYSQQNPIYNLYGSNITPVNQAASLLKPDGEMTILGRRRWTGIEGAPEVLWVNGYAPIKNINATAGINLRYERAGEEKAANIGAFFAKAIRVGENDYFAMSVNAGLSTYRGIFSGIDSNDDPVYNNNISSNTAQVGAGLMLYHPNKYYIGISTPGFAVNRAAAGTADYIFKNQYFLTGGIQLIFSDDFTLKPAAILSYLQDEKLWAGISAMAIVKQSFGLGINADSKGGVAGLAQVYLSNFNIGYSYQFSVGQQMNGGQTNNASQEILLSYSFGY